VRSAWSVRAALGAQCSVLSAKCEVRSARGVRAVPRFDVLGPSKGDVTGDGKDEKAVERPTWPGAIETISRPPSHQ
jgi:hypothetical protein